MTEETLRNAIHTLQDRFGLQTAELQKYPPALLVPVEQIVTVCQVLHDEFGFNALSDLTASDYWPEQQPRMHAVYNLYSHEHNVRLCLRVPLNGDALSLPSVEGIYYNANWHERELFDMFGIDISGHSDLRRIIMPADWEGHPLRKDYPLGYEEPQFTFNFDEIDRRKHKARYEEA